MPSLQPVLLERRVVPKVWGGAAISEMLDCPVGDGEAVGETWELFDRPDGSNAIRGGDGMTLSELVKSDPVGVLGAGVAPGPGGRFPLLLKFIDARDALSVQVHPGPADVADVGDGPKDEAWLVLRAGKSARIIRGFQDGVDRAAVEAAVGSEAIEPLLHAFVPRVGDVISVNAGVVHALGPEVLLFEVQQNSDLTYRLWDWGRPREIHLERGLAALQVGSAGPDQVPSRPHDENSTWLVRGPHFGVRRFALESQIALPTEESFKVLTVLDGMAALGWHSGGDEPPIPVRKGDTVVIPAVIEEVFLSPIGGIDFLWTDAGEGS